MIYEFALDPALVATWHDRLEYLFFEEKFGVQSRRITSTYPKDWKKLVWAAFENGGTPAGDMAKKRLEVVLSDVLSGTIKRVSTFSEVPDWLERAETENVKRPFRAILSKNNPRSNVSVIDSEMLLEYGHDLWSIPDLNTVSRTPAEIAVALKSTIQFCKKAIFIEPYFSSTDRTLSETLGHLFDVLWNIRIPGNDPVVQFQVKIDIRADEVEANRFISECELFLQRTVPSGKRIELIVKKNKYGQQRFHNRYILTESIGIGLPTGLAHADTSRSETDDLYILSRAQYQERWIQYVNGTPSPFETLAQKVITGSYRI
jgi:hypothetical protein